MDEVEDPNPEAFSDGWFRTGDKGYLDAKGCVWLLGRFKEIVNRGGEKISPLAVEDWVRQAPATYYSVIRSGRYSVLQTANGEGIRRSFTCYTKQFPGASPRFNG